MAPSGPGGPPSARDPSGDDSWTGLYADALPEHVEEWAVLPWCGAVVSFWGTARDHAEGRPGVESLSYEAYEQQALARIDAVVDAARGQWPELGRVAVLHRVGALAIGDRAVVVAVSAPHRGEAFEAARYCIDTVKDTVPLWKHEQWAGGQGWGTGSRPVGEPARPEVRAWSAADRPSRPVNSQ